MRKIIGAVLIVGLVAGCSSKDDTAAETKACAHLKSYAESVAGGASATFVKNDGDELLTDARAANDIAFAGLVRTYIVGTQAGADASAVAGATAAKTQLNDACGAGTIG